MLSTEDAKQAVEAYRERASSATAALKAMLGQVDELPDEFAGLAQELRARISTLIAQVDSLSAMVQSTNDRYGPSGTDIAHTFTTVYGRPAA